ncbi:MAG: thiamine pyrophosphate-dependent dehydrogenase E1 component subunit alpha [Nitrospirota bacterium]|nr:thiamine pyrophosphate-dependent dehydrogenase E1 component subunit alpha [Nitrospirota bacterium]MDH5586117.1 thiamine pyrophosphate-dependent dehydrogenase E1 component subunit alpha [Nitrospirota bacterium]MDH5774638.1 thiamine pyrophosphate-dependent dehydrogenase E1 component subunit alpha [Nitrospirota bacterium]
MTNIFKQLFYQALRIRLVEEHIIDLYPSDVIQSPVHLSIGQEAVAVGACQTLTSQDLLFSTYRSHAFYLAKGGNLKEMFAELYGKVTGCARGKAGSMHLAAPDVGFMGASAVVASTIPHAVGAALAAKRLKKNQIIVGVFGDGATEEGVYHESLNFAALHRLPVIFLCENNGLAVHSSRQARQNFEIIEHAGSYGLKTFHISEGYDFVKVADAMSEVIRHVRTTHTPAFVEVQTFRYKEHVGPGDDFSCGYRNISEFHNWKDLDPLMQYPNLVESFRPRIVEEIEEAIQFAKGSAFPSIEELLCDVV